MKDSRDDVALGKEEGDDAPRAVRLAGDGAQALSFLRQLPHAPRHAILAATRWFGLHHVPLVLWII
jgi:hypothetical protein